MPCCSPEEFFRTVSPAIFPPLAGAIFVLTVLTTLAISYLMGHISGIPYISDTGTHQPESSIFSFFLSLYSFCLGMSAWSVYKSVSTIYDDHNDDDY